MLEAIGFIGTLLAIAAYLPQILSLVRSRSSVDLDLRSWLIWFVATGCILARSLSGSDTLFKVLSVSNFTFVTITLCLICFYRGLLTVRWGRRGRTARWFRR